MTIRVPRIARSLAALLALAALPAGARAQIPWESPLLVVPGAPGGVSLSFVDYGLAPDDGMGGILSWRSTRAGLRVAATRRRFDDMPGLAAGFDLSWPVLRRSESGVDASFTTGLGGSWADYGQAAVPLAFTAGRAIDGSLLFHPWAGTRLVLSGFVGSERPSDFDYALAADLGFDLAFDQGRDVRLRFAASLGDRHALVAGLYAAH